MMRSHSRRHSFAFTILEVLIALTASLLMMLALTRAFKLIGDKITQSQSELELSSTLRNVSFSLRDELSRLTPPMITPQPRDAAAGYFTYYEGPWADGTTALIQNSGPQAGYLPTSRYGDLDDYLAFTAKAKAGAPFVGMIPRGVIEAHRFEAWLAAGTPGTFVTHDGIPAGSYTLADAFALVPFYSDYAEIAYFCQPEWQRDALGQPVYDTNGNPLFVDVINELGGTAIGDNIPDRLNLHRRVLLIRPDLNMTPRRMYRINTGGAPSGAAGTDENIPQLPLLIPPSGPTPMVVRPLASQDDRFQVGPWNPAIGWPGSVVDAQRPPWLTGLARVQQFMDLSVARITRNWNGAGNPGYGMPADTSDSTGGPAGIAANSLRSLMRPENRFAAVRIPLSVMGGSASNSTMPLLALCPPHPFLATAEQNSLSTVPRFGQAMTGNPVNYGPLTMVGFLRPEFSLTDYSVANRTSPATAASTSNATYRGGTDIIATDVLGFDVQVYDSQAPNFVWMGTPPINVPGNPGDDDNDGAVEELDELGLANTDDALVTVNSPALNPLVGTAPSVFASTANTLPPGSNEYFNAPPGEFIDYGYVRLPGGMVGGTQVLETLPLTPPAPGTTRAQFANMFTTAFSGRSADSTTHRYPTSWEDSGRIVIGGGSLVNSFVQPTIDTWTETYTGDGFEQGPLNPSNPNQLFQFNINGSTPPGPGPGTSVRATIWSNRAESASLSGPGFVDGSTTARQSTSPSISMPRAVKISIRVYDRSAGEIRQQSVIRDFQQ